MLVLLTFRGGGGGVVQNRESPDFRSPEVDRYEVMKYFTGLSLRFQVVSCICFTGQI